MKKILYFVNLIILNFIFSVIGLASECQHVYTIGAYDEAFSKRAVVTKLGPISVSKITKSIPLSFLEKDGSYGGGEAFCSIQQACHALKQQLKSKILPENENWHIYLLDADWHHDVYQLHPNDFRVKHSVKVLKLVKKDCSL